MRWMPSKKRACSAALVLAVWALLAWLAASALIVRAGLPHADVIVVLSGSTTYVERTRLAARLFHEGEAGRILLTNDDERGGWSNTQQRNLLFIERAAEELGRAGVPEERVLKLPQPVSNTHQEALVVRSFAEAQGLRSIMLVTSAYHSRRALWTWKNVFEGSNVQIGIEPVATGQQSPSTALWWLQPRGWSMVAGEYLKIIYYRVYYR